MGDVHLREGGEGEKAGNRKEKDVDRKSKMKEVVGNKVDRNERRGKMKAAADVKTRPNG